MHIELKRSGSKTKGKLCSLKKVFWLLLDLSKKLK